jgi:hypothetical protein
VSLQPLGRGHTTASGPPGAELAGAPPRRRRSLIRLVLEDRRAAAMAATWYVAILLAFGPPDLQKAVGAIVTFPLLVVIGAIGLLLLPGNLLSNLDLEIPEPFQTAYWLAFLLTLALLHAWLLRAWRWSVLAVLALILCASSYGCVERLSLQ